ncbi:MAG: flippase-like domain-containing protein [Lachnospiraceae bacterium]|nr:flippase-like domain-containing protein [Lachnospiraceae bacterium]
MSSSLKKFLKYTLNVLLIIGITYFALHTLFKDNEPGVILKKIGEADIKWIMVAVLLMVFFVCGESIQFRMLFKGMKQKVSFIKCILLSNIGFFFSQITPGASGGQPLQIVYMTKLGVNAFVSTLVCMMVTLVYKLSLVVLFLIALIIKPVFVGNAIFDVLLFFIIGIVIQAGFGLFLLACVLKPSLAAGVVNWFINIGAKLHLVKRPDETRKKAENSIKQYEMASDFIKGNKLIMLKMAIITILQRLAYFGVAFCVAMALKIEDCNPIEIIALQIILSLAVDMLPIPGASGANEILFVRLQTMIFGQAVSAGLLLNRGITYYFLAIVTGVFTLIAHIYFKRIKAKADSKALAKAEEQSEHP